jgi:hypothetical protein
MNINYNDKDNFVKKISELMNKVYILKLINCKGGKIFV